MTKLIELPTYDKGEDDVVHVVIETPRGSSVKLVLDPKLGVITYERPLPLGLRYPYDWGFVPGTRAEDGDPVDAMVLSSAATYPGVVIPAKLVGVIEIEERGEKKGRVRNDRVLAVPYRAPPSESFAFESGVPRALRKELEEFFVDAVRLEGKELKVLGWHSAAEAKALIDRSRR